MAVRDSAVKLSEEIKNSKEYKDFKKSMKEIKNDRNCEKLLKEYKDIQLVAQGYIMRNEQVDKRVIAKFENIQKKVTNNKKLCNYIKNEQKFKMMMDDINKILAKAVEKDYK